MESTYCELTEMCINSTSKSAQVIYCGLIDHIKMYGFKQQLALFAQGSVGCLSSAGSFPLSYLMRLVRWWLEPVSLEHLSGMDEEMAHSVTASQTLGIGWEFNWSC